MKSFSFYPGPANNTKPCRITDLKALAEEIRTNKKWIELIHDLRSLKGETEQSDFKKQKLPYVTFSGIFNYRAADQLIKHSGLFCVDCDHIGNTGEIKELQKKIKEFYNPGLMFVSPRGEGLKIVFKIDINHGEHTEYYLALRKFFKDELGIEIDNKPQNVASACFLSHDPDVYYNDTPSSLDREFLTKYQIVDDLIADNIITDDNSQFESAKKWLDRREAFVLGNRNHYITSLVDVLNRYGVSEDCVLQKLRDFECEGFTLKEIDAIIKSRYKHKEHHGIAAGIKIANEPPKKKQDIPFVRVGTTFYKVIRKPNRYGIEETHLKPWNKDTLLQDYKSQIIQFISKYDDFTMNPDNLNHNPIIRNCYNLYAPFKHVPRQGEWTWTERLLRHVFGDQYDLGLRYMQILFLHPDRSTIILVLVSKERGTGKTTFLNWLDMIFGANMALISSSDFLSAFNGHYATKNLICIEETCFDKALTIEKLKALATQKVISINEKFVQHYKIPFYGKVIMTSNFEDRFLKIDKEEIRFLIRKLGTPEFINHNIETNLLEEIPPFLHYLKSMPPVDWNVSRSGFTVEELQNKELREVVQESRSGLYKDLEIEITDFFDNNELEYFDASPKDLKQKFHAYDNQVSPSYLNRVLKKEFEMKPREDYRGNPVRYTPFDEVMSPSKTGRPFRFYRREFTSEVQTDQQNPQEDAPF